jgi:glycosyltransferase involved in cell wall biosynthesis
MISPKLASLLVLAPHFRVFIKDQVVQISPFFKSVSVVIPFPRFSRIALMPCFRGHFSLPKYAEESRSEKDRNLAIISPSYFTLPFEVLRKRDHQLIAKSTIKALTRNNVSFDLIHSHFLELGYTGVILKRIFNKPLIVTAHGGDVYNLPFKNKWHKTIAKNVLNEANRVITVSQSNIEKLLLLGVSPKKLHVIPNGYDDSLFKPSSTIEARKKLGLPLKKKILLSVGNLVEVKGQSYLIAAFELVAKKRNDVFLVIVGAGVLRRTLYKKARSLGLEKKVFFAGYRKHETIPLWMNASDVFVLPSLNEGFPTVIPESLACGKPVVASMVGGISEILNKEVGVLVKPENVTSLLLGIDSALNRKWDSTSISRYSQNYSWRSLTPRLLSVYEQTLCDCV